MSETPGEYVVPALTDERLAQIRHWLRPANQGAGCENCDLHVLVAEVDKLRARLADLEPKYAALSVEIQAHDEASDPVHLETIDRLARERDAALVALAEARGLLLGVVDCVTHQSGLNRPMIAEGKGRQFGMIVGLIDVVLRQPVPSERGRQILAAAEAMAGAWETTGYTGHWSRMKTAVDAYRALVPARQEGGD